MNGNIDFGERLATGIALFEDGEFWHAHEAWEDAWRACPEYEQDFFQGLILLTAGLYKLDQRGARPQSMHRLLGKAKRRLADFVPEHRNVNLDAALKAIEALQKEALRHFDAEDGWQNRASREEIPRLSQTSGM